MQGDGRGSLPCGSLHFSPVGAITPSLLLLGGLWHHAEADESLSSTRHVLDAFRDSTALLALNGVGSGD